MSKVAMQWAMCQAPRVTNSEFKVLMALAYHHNDPSGRCDPSQVTMMKLTGIGDSKWFRELLKQLIAKGFVEVTRRTGVCNNYVLAMTSTEGDGHPVSPGGEHPGSQPPRVMITPGDGHPLTPGDGHPPTRGDGHPPTPGDDHPPNILPPHHQNEEGRRIAEDWQPSKPTITRLHRAGVPPKFASDQGRIGLFVTHHRSRGGAAGDFETRYYRWSLKDWRDEQTSRASGQPQERQMRAGGQRFANGYQDPNNPPRAGESWEAYHARLRQIDQRARA